jgi:transmembrane sensor
LGTRFSVEVAGTELRVRLVEGRITVGVPGSGTKAYEMRPGQELISRRGSAIISQKDDTPAAVTSPTGVIIFDNETLVEAAAELNRYSRRRLIVRHPRVAELRVSGSFARGDVERFARVLTEIHPVRVVRREDGTVELLPKR